jgi:hypothetical protein
MRLVRYTAIVSAAAFSFPAGAWQVPPKTSVAPKPVATHMNMAPDAAGSVPFQVSINGYGAVRWGPMLCAPKAGSQSALCNRTAPKGKMLIVQAFPANGLKFGGWAGACAGQGIRCVLTPAGPTTLSATFAPPAQQAMATIKVAIPGAGGRVGPDPFTGGPIDCVHQLKGYSGGTCQATVPVGSQMILVATAEPKAEFTGWQSDQSGCSGQNCAFTVTGPVTVTAVFAAQQAKPNMGTFTVSYERTHWSAYMFTTNPKLPMSCSDVALPPKPPEPGVSYAPGTGPETVYLSSCKITQPIGTSFDIYAQEGVVAQGGGISDVTGGWGGACANAAGAVCHVTITGPHVDATLGGDAHPG